MLIPREGDKVRIYIQLKSQDATNAATIKSQMGPHQLLCPSVFLKKKEIWPIYSWNRWHGNHSNLTLFKRQRLLIGVLFISVRSGRSSDSSLLKIMSLSSVGQRVASKFSVEVWRTCLHRWRWLVILIHLKPVCILKKKQTPKRGLV